MGIEAQKKKHIFTTEHGDILQLLIKYEINIDNIMQQKLLFQHYFTKH